MKNSRLKRACLDSEYAYRTRGRSEMADELCAGTAAVDSGAGTDSVAATGAEFCGELFPIASKANRIASSSA